MCAAIVVDLKARAIDRASAGPARLLFVDNIRATMILLVFTMHAADTYSPFGNWYFTDRGPAGLATKIVFGAYQSFLQAFFMALLFFVSGYFAAPALDRKGAQIFVRDRLLRLGIPTLLYMFAIGPLTQYFLSHTWGTGGFVHQWLTHLYDGEWLSETGPMWFCAALLAFSIVYALVRTRALISATLPRTGAIVGFTAAMALATFIVRIVSPENLSVFNMHFGDFPQYVLMFGAGIVAYRGRWLELFPARLALRWSALFLVVAGPLFASLLVFGGALRGSTDVYNGGFNAVSAAKCVWESLVCVGMSLGLLALFRRFFNAQGAAARFLSDNAFAVYVFHPPVLIALARLIHPIELPAIPKAMLLALLAAVATFALAAGVFRRIPLLARVL